MSHTISTTIRPDQVLEVDDAEYADLMANGLVLIDYSQTAAAAPTPEPTPKKTAASAAKDKEA